jgi:ribonuclease Z
MGRVIVMGSASAVPDATHENTHVLVEAGSRVVLVDCPGSPMVRLEQAGIEPNRLTDIILTHFHPDHVSGFGPLLMGLWLIGRKESLSVYGLSPTIERARKMMELYDWEQWPDFYPVRFVPLPEQEHAQVLCDDDLLIYSSPVSHLIPTIGLRFEFVQGSRVLTYSCDTEPSQAVRRLADGADVLIHEATGASVGHTSPEKAGEIAAQAGVSALYLIHYPPQLVHPEELVARARKTFQGKISVAHDFLSIDVNRGRKKPA